MSERRKRALVTGGATGIGQAAVLALARAGFDIALNFHSSVAAANSAAAEARDAGARVLAIRCDVSDDVAVRAMLAEVDAAFGGLEALINNAGTTIPNAPKDLEGVSVADWDRVFAVNVRGLWLVTRAAVPLLKKGEAPCIVNTASIVGLRPGPQPLPYAASKAAIVSLTRQFAGALGPDIRVNAVAPGWMEGEWMERMLGENYVRLMERRAKMTPLGRCVTAEDVAQTMLSLILHNAFVNGEIVVIDGGFASVT
jgi:3-oxoacyl-[acyl-carrier protein] reductase